MCILLWRSLWGHFELKDVHEEAMHSRNSSSFELRIETEKDDDTRWVVHPAQTNDFRTHKRFQVVYNGFYSRTLRRVQGVVRPNGFAARHYYGVLATWSRGGALPTFYAESTTVRHQMHLRILSHLKVHFCKNRWYYDLWRLYSVMKS